MAEQNNTPLPEGLRFFNKHENAPDFVIGSVVITLEDLFAFTKANPSLCTDYQGKKQLKLQLLTSQAGTTYFKVDTYKKADGAAAAKPAAKPVAPAAITPVEDDLPF